MIEALGSIPNTTKLNKNLWLFKKKIGSPDKKKINKETLKLSETVDQMSLHAHSSYQQMELSQT
jgi:hypothetical protein